MHKTRRSCSDGTQAAKAYRVNLSLEPFLADTINETLTDSLQVLSKEFFYLASGLAEFLHTSFRRDLPISVDHQHSVRSSEQLFNFGKHVFMHELPKRIPQTRLIKSGLRLNGKEKALFSGYLQTFKI